MNIKTPILVVLAAFLGVASLQAQETDYPTLRARAEAFMAEGSFAKAREVYQQATNMQLSPADLRWVDFRLADTLWRSEAATHSSDDTQIENAHQQLDVLIRDLKNAEDHDRVWAEVQASLGDFFWARRNQQNWGEAWPHYQAALDWWAGAADLDLAREHYLKIIWAVTDKPAWRGPGDYYYFYYGGALPIEFLENALKIAQKPNDIAHAHYLLAMAFRNQSGDWDQRQRIPEEFEGALKLGKATKWYDDALFNYAEWMENNGRVVFQKDGGWNQEPDYVKALELYRRLVKEFSKGETRYYDRAQQQISNLTGPSVGVNVANVFLPDSEIQYNLNWRNVKRIDLALYAVDLSRDTDLSEDDAKRNNWLDNIDLSRRDKIKSWQRDTKDKGDYKPGAETIHWDGKLPVGAYVLEARAGDKTARELVLVTDATVVLKTSGRQALVYMCDALAGSPLAGAEVKLWERYWDDQHWHWREASKQTSADGIAVFDLEQRADDEQIFAGARLKDRQAFGMGNNYFNRMGQETGDWRIYAFTDRPAYRPNETVQWKFIARTKRDGAAYTTPANEVVSYRIDDPRGAKVIEANAALNAFGSAWGTLELKDNLPLGEYRITFLRKRSDNGDETIGDAILFRLEEYKLPEFKVSVETPEENSRKKAFRLGEKVEVNVQADYYFGGPVANASVEVVVTQNPFYHTWQRPHDYPWFYENAGPQNFRGRFMYGGQGQIIKRETLKTDAIGKASLTFDTPQNNGSGQDFEYSIEARVTDASRREIAGNGNVRVTSRRYYVYAEPDHNLYHPQDKAGVEFKALDANDQPVVTEGTVKVTRDYWMEIWLDPSGREVKGDELKGIRNRSLIFPPPPTRPEDGNWQLKFRGYEHDEILTRRLKTDTNGVAELNFTPERDGYYRIAWTSPEDTKTNAPPAPPIESETAVWVATRATTDLGYRHGGMEIIVDQDTFRVGQKAPVMLSVPMNDRYVLFSVEGDDLYSYQLVHVTGTVKLVELPIEEKHVPNIFLSAVLVSDRQLFVDTKQVVVPPTKNFLTVDVKPDREQYQPREPGTFTITTRNDQNEPVAAEVAFGLVDESVYYIQNDYAGDPRQFYFDEKRNQEVQTESTFNQKTYAKLVPGEDNQLIDIRDFELRKRRRLMFERERDLGDVDFSGATLDADAIENSSGAVFDERLDGLKKFPMSRLEMTKSKDIHGFGGGGGGGIGGVFYAGNRVMNATSAAPASIAGGIMLSDKLGVDGEMPAMPPGVTQGQEPAVQVRSDFRATVFWQPNVMTGKDGTATVKVTYPDSLTGWKATARAVTTVNQFGIATTNTHTKQPLIVRLQAPRFFVVGDTVTISAVVNNNTGEELATQVQLDADISGFAPKDPMISQLKVPANGEARADWVINISQPGEAKLKVTARGGKYADAMEKSYTIYEHGIEKFVSKSGKVRGDDVTVKLELPVERKADSTTLTVQIAPSMAVTMLDALPYLIDYPYGCTEQTMSRFLPAVITVKTLGNLGLKPDDVMNHLFGGIEPASAAATHPNGKHDLHELDEITRQCLERLYDFQHADGGWGWWKEGESDHFMTAYVVWGLALARDAGISLKDGALQRGASYLDKALVDEEQNHDVQAWMLHALSVYETEINRGKATPFQAKAFDNLWNNREKLNAYTRALLALSAHGFGYEDKARVLVENLENGIKRDDSPDASALINGVSPSTTNSQPSTTLGTAHWGEDGIYWHWSDGGVEATAFALRALLAIDPHNKLIEPVSNWLIKNRRGAQWNNTRDTAITILAMNDYLRASGELAPEMEYELSVNGQAIVSRKISNADVLNAPSQFAIDPKLLRDGANEIHIVRRSGQGAIYFAANAKYFSQEEPVTAAGNEIFVRRQYYKLVGRPTLLKGYVYDRQPLNDGGTVRSGERIETVVTIEAKNNYEYLMFEDLKPAGFEAVEVRSGESLYAYELKSGAVELKLNAGTNSPSAPMTDEDHTGRSRWVYQELRDRKVALFIDKLPQGIWEIKYDMRAEVPGKFHALPVVGRAMYVPEIRCNGAEARITVEDAK